MRVSHLIILASLVLVVGLVILAFAGIVSLGPLNQKNLTGIVDLIVQRGSGYSPAKTPGEAMTNFREAIHKRKFKIAAAYCTKSYADMLERAHPAASELGTTIDQIRDYAKEKGLLTDRTAMALQRLDPFPRNFNLQGQPVVSKDDDKKATGVFVWEMIPLRDPAKVATDADLAQLDPTMFNMVLAPDYVFTQPIELVKDKDEWKLNIQTNQQWETNVNLFVDRYKSYNTALNSFRIYMTNQRYDTPLSFEGDVMGKLKEAKPR